MRWFVESEEELTDEDVLKLLQHKKSGKPSCESCPTRHAHGYAVLDHEAFMPNKPTYISTKEITDES